MSERTVIENDFYTPFDRELIGGGRSPAPYRTLFQQDRDRVLHTSAFRRLQAKTQVFQSGEYDFYRTRLTHSLEVAQLGRGICSYLKQTSPWLGADYHIDEDLVEACCLAHDIGHPPFGHAGESSLNRLMKDSGGFEGNAQTLRLISDTIYSDHSARKGLSPTRAFLDSILKYKTIWNATDCPPKKFLYADQAHYVDKAAGDDPTSVARCEPSIECQIMDWADDTAYCLGDLMDGVRAKFITVTSIQNWRKQNDRSAGHKQYDELFEELSKALQERCFTKHVNKYYGDCVQAVSLETRRTNTFNSITNRYKFQLRVAPAARLRCQLLQKMSRELVFQTPQVHQLEFKGNMILERMFNGFKEHYLEKHDTDTSALQLLPPDMHAAVRKVPRSEPNQRARLICDHIAGMSDDFAVRTYKRMFEAGFGSIVDLV